MSKEEQNKLASMLSQPANSKERKIRRAWRQDERYIAEASQSVTETILGQIGTREALTGEFIPPKGRSPGREKRIVDARGGLVEQKMKRLGIEVTFDDVATYQLSTEQFKMDKTKTGNRLTDPSVIVFQRGGTVIAPAEWNPQDWLPEE